MDALPSANGDEGKPERVAPASADKSRPAGLGLHSEPSPVPSAASSAGGGGGLSFRAASSLPVSPSLAVSMKAFSPVRSVRKNSLSDHSLGISRSKTPVDDPMSLLYNMNDCYSKLKELVPSIPQNKKVSKMEILQHVIDYILDLQIALDSHPTIVSLHHQRPGQNQASRTPLTTLNTDISILSLQVRPAPGPPPRRRTLPRSPGLSLGDP
ncbi:DNA-binding protein inhibitor ID-2 isoform X1 [Piliocolobus tephrosceles]|uniref:DNA-binding protein inhibitor ID-2 isoform X1 n=1 Tax=Piliocolobus tephrosceles TaxID=591936 RepID=UPI000C2AFFA8|nr:DNA-binding protein inhibitor ID-2 isoform X1 [Piliocolobus tephrosceles]